MKLKLLFFILLNVIGSIKSADGCIQDTVSFTCTKFNPTTSYDDAMDKYKKVVAQFIDVSKKTNAYSNFVNTLSQETQDTDGSSVICLDYISETDPLNIPQVCIQSFTNLMKLAGDLGTSQKTLIDLLNNNGLDCQNINSLKLEKKDIQAGVNKYTIYNSYPLCDIQNAMALMQSQLGDAAKDKQQKDAINTQRKMQQDALADQLKAQACTDSDLKNYQALTGTKKDEFAIQHPACIQRDIVSQQMSTQSSQIQSQQKVVLLQEIMGGVNTLLMTAMAYPAIKEVSAAIKKFGSENKFGKWYSAKKAAGKIATIDVSKLSSELSSRFEITVDFVNDLKAAGFELETLNKLEKGIKLAIFEGKDVKTLKEIVDNPELKGEALEERLGKLGIEDVAMKDAIEAVEALKAVK